MKAPEKGTGFCIETIPFGTPIRDEQGHGAVAMADIVQVCWLIEGKAVAGGILSPEDALVLAGQISTAARKLMADRIAEPPHPATLLVRSLLRGLLPK